MASPVKTFGFSSFLDSFRDTLDEYLPKSSSGSIVALNSSALIHTAYNVLRNAHYSFKAADFGVNDLSHFLSARVSFLEGALISLASTVHNFFFALIYTIAIVGTFGVAQSLVNNCNHHWINCYYSFLTTGSGLASVITPQYGSYLSLGVFVHVLNSILNDYKDDIGNREPELTGRVKKIFKQYFETINNWARSYYDNYEPEVKNSLDWLMEQVTEAEAIFYNPDKPDEVYLFGIIDEFWKKFPKLKPLAENTEIIEI
ncbi:MAG: hypothetical protein JSS30_03930 [Verrucomicrobia bacterium]|nr:hypothetical protein [Verrucomicrobiota bacterium]